MSDHLKFRYEGPPLGWWNSQTVELFVQIGAIGGAAWFIWWVTRCPQ